MRSQHTPGPRFIGNCFECKKISTKEFNEQKIKTIGKCLFKRDVKIWGRIAEGRFIRALEDCQCPLCGKRGWNGKKIHGNQTEHVCDDRCTMATGHQCDCSCGGKNHGSGHMVAVGA